MMDAARLVPRRHRAAACGASRASALVMLAALAVVSALLLSPPFALAADPTSPPEIGTLGDGTVTGHLVVAASLERVRAFLADPYASQRIVADIQTFTVTADGLCDRVDIVAKGVFDPVRYAKRRCATETGYVETLIDGDFRDFRCEWFLAQVPAGVDVRYHLRLTTKFAVPRFILTGRLKASTRDILVAFRKAVTR